MGVEVEGPDGKVHTFPDGTPPETINEQMTRVYGGAGSLQPNVPKAGEPTAAAGAVMPNMMSVPKYRTNEDWDQLMLSQLFPHAQTILQNTPGHKLRVKAAEKTGENLANLEERQRGGLQVLEMLNQLGHTADEGHAAGTLDQAIGPLDSSPTWQRVRAAIPLVGGYYEKGYNLHNQLMHDIHGLTTAFISSAGKGGIQMSDARQKAFEETMGAMMKATTKEEFDKIKVDADRIIRGTFGLAPGAYVEPSRSARAAPAAAAPVRQQFRNKKTGAIETFEWDGREWKKVP